MREIKFRGKVADETNEWVYGYLTRKNNIYQEKEHKTSKYCGFGIFTVDTTTIGQFTGLYDKNGTEIYEGDIIKLTGKCKDWTGVIEFGNPNSFYNWGFQIKPIHSWVKNYYSCEILCWIDMQ